MATLYPESDQIPDGSVTRWNDDVHREDDVAAEQSWSVYSAQMAALQESDW